MTILTCSLLAGASSCGPTGAEGPTAPATPPPTTASTDRPEQPDEEQETADLELVHRAGPAGRALQPNDPRMRAVEAYLLAQRRGEPLSYGRR